MWKIFLAILAIFLLLAAFREPIADGIKSWRTQDKTQTFAIVTGVGETSSNVTLSNDLFQDDVAEVIAFTSNVVADAPTADAYDTTIKQLTIGGLLESRNHSVSVEYYAETDDVTLRIVGPFMGLLIFGGLIAAIVIRAVQKDKGR